MNADRQYYLHGKDQLRFRDNTVMDFFNVSEKGIRGFYVGYICVLKDASGVPTYSVRLAICQNEVAVAKTLDDGVAALAAYYEKNPPWWHRQSWRRSERHIRETKCGKLSVDEIEPGKWVADRRGHELLIKGKRAIFPTCAEAQRAADAHLRAHGLDDRKKSNDGYSWASDASVP